MTPVARRPAATGAPGRPVRAGRARWSRGSGNRWAPLGRPRRRGPPRPGDAPTARRSGPSRASARARGRGRSGRASIERRSVGPAGRGRRAIDGVPRRANGTLRRVVEGYRVPMTVPRAYDPRVVARRVARAAYWVTLGDPLCRHYALSGRIRRAARSIHNGIARGYATGTRAATVAAVGATLVSVADLKCHIGLAADLGLVAADEAGRLLHVCDRLSRLLVGFRRHLVLGGAGPPLGGAGHAPHWLPGAGPE